MSTKERVIILIAVVLTVAGFVYWYFNRANFASPVAPQVPVVPTSTATYPHGAQSLGEKIYENSQNPIGSKIPSLNPVTNPLDGAYKNPFE